MGRTDEEIISQVLAGHKQVFSVLINRYQKQIFNLMYRYSRSDQEASDLTQEVFLRAFEKIGSFRPGSSFFSWLYALAVNRARDWRRTQNRMNRCHHELRETRAEPVRPESGQEKILLRQEEMSRLQNAMEQLPDDTREILMLRYHQYCSVKVAAEIFSISESAVKMRTLRGLKQLQDIMRDNDHEQ